MIQLSQDVIQKMKEHAIRDYPNECCGFFFGSVTDEGKWIDRSIQVKNNKKGDQRRRFEIAAEDYMQGEAYSEQFNTVFAGIYHSHPNHPAIPSEHDRKQAMPFFSYIIISVTDMQVNEVRSWKLTIDGNFEEERIKILETKSN